MFEPVRSIEYCLIIGEMEGVHAKLKKLGTHDEIEFLEAMKKKYYKLYFDTRKQEMLDADKE